MQEESHYVINVFGRKPTEVQVGFIDKVSGQPKGNTQAATMDIGEKNIPNYSIAWGYLEVDAKDKKLTGKIEFLPWGHPKGREVRIRYLPNCPSISMEYQEEKKLTVSDAWVEITLKTGQNRFKRATQANLILMLEHHGLNRSNGSRNPENRKTSFETWKSDEKTTVMASEIETRQMAEKIVLNAKNSHAKLVILATLFEIDVEQSDEQLFKQLIQWSQNFVNFFEILEGHAKRYSELLTKASDLELIDLQSNEIVSIVIGGKKDLLMDGIDGKSADERIEYITDNITEPQIYHALNRLAGEFERYQVVLQ